MASVGDFVTCDHVLKVPGPCLEGLVVRGGDALPYDVFRCSSTLSVLARGGANTHTHT